MDRQTHCIRRSDRTGRTAH